MRDIGCNFGGAIMNKMLNDFADAGIYLIMRAMQFGFLALGLFMFVGQLVWGTL